MSTRRLQSHLSTALLMLFVIACQDAPLAPGPSFSMGGNSDAAHQCQQGGYQDLFRTDGTGFKNAGDCTSYAAQGGTLATLLTATFTKVLFGACNQLTFGYELDGVENNLQTKPGGCFGLAGADRTVTFLSTQTLRVFLRDDTCSDTYLEDGNHAVVTGSNPFDIKIADSGGFCERGPDVDATDDIIESGSGNLNVTKTIS